MGFGPNRVRSLPDGVAQALAEYLDMDAAESVEAESENGNGYYPALEIPAEQMPLKIGDLCPDCGAASVVNEEGCRKCYNCGYSEC